MSHCCKVKPLENYLPGISYRVKYVDVESERVFGDVIVTQQTGSYSTYSDVTFCYHTLPIYKKRKRNLIEKILDSPNFFELNSKRVSRRNSLAPPASTSKRTIRRTKSVGNPVASSVSEDLEDRESSRIDADVVKIPKVYPTPLPPSNQKRDVPVCSLVDQLLMDIYGLPSGSRSESDSTASSSLKQPPRHRHLQRTRLLLKNENELKILVENLREHITHTGGLLVRQLRRKDYLIAKRDKQYDIITAHLQAHSAKRIEDTKMKFSLTPQPGESGFQQWLDAMKMVARLHGGIPPEFRKRLWSTLAERHLEQRGVDWKQAEKVCFNEWSNPDDEELGIQIVKDLHRTGCSLFCGAAGRDNQAVLRRVLLGFARWNKSVGYCQGLNVLAALVLQVMDRAESSSVKVMIYLIEGVLPEGYFADNLRGLSVDMAVFRDLLRARMPKLSKHLEALQNDAKDKATGNSYEPPLMNVFTMQWFLTLFCHCLPQEAVLRVWDLIFLEGDEVLLRTALAIWEGLSDRIMTVTSADEFYSIMGVLTREMLEFTDTNSLIKNIVSMGPLHGVTNLREKHRYNITPWARKLSDDDDSETEEDERLAVAAAMFSMAQRLKKEHIPSTMGALQAIAPGSDRERLALDISTLKQQYAKLRERQRQAHIILSAACARQSMVPPPTSQAMNHLLVGKNALVSAKNRSLSFSSSVTPSKTRPTVLYSPRTQNRKDRQGVTLHWKDTKRPKQRSEKTADPAESSTTSVQPATVDVPVVDQPSPKRGSIDSDSDSTSTELCDELDRRSDVDSEELTSTSDIYVMATTDGENKQHRVDDLTETAVCQSPDDANIESITDCVATETNLQKKEEKDSAKSATSISIDRSKEEKEIEKSSESIEVPVVDEIPKLPPKDAHETTFSRSSYQVDVNECKKDDFALDTSRVHSLAFDKIAEEISSEMNSMKLSLNAIDDYVYSNYKDKSMESRRDEASQETSKFNIERTTNIETIEKTDRLPLVVDKNSEKVVSMHENVEIVNNSERIVRNDVLSKYNDAPLADANVSESLSSPTDTNQTRSQSLLRSFDGFSSSSSSSSSSSNVRTEKISTSSIDRDPVIDSITHVVPYERSPPYPTTYSTEHLSISPMMVDEKKLSNVFHSSPVIDNIDITAVDTTRLSSDMTVDNATFNDKQDIVQTKSYFEAKRSLKTPESTKSFSSGETMGPDSKASSLTVSPRTPVRSESRNTFNEKSLCSSVSSDSKTLILRSVDSDTTRDSPKFDAKKSSYERSSLSTPISTDSLKNKSEASPKLIVSSSSDSCSPSKVKSSERSFSSDLQSPISANSIKYTSSYGKRGQDNLSGSPLDLSAATSPFYPIANPNQKTPSPYCLSRRRCSMDSVETSPEQRSTGSKDTTKFLGGNHIKLESSKMENRENVDDVPKKTDSYVRPQFTAKSNDFNFKLSGENEDLKNRDSYETKVNDEFRISQHFIEENSDDPSLEKDTVPQLPQEKLDKHFLNLGYRHRNRSRPLERSSSSLERRFADLKSSVSTDEFTTSVVKKRSSDILEDIKHLEAKAFSDCSSESGLLTKKTSYIWEDFKNLEARRQDNFSDSARNFSKCRLDIPNISVTAEGRKSYIVHPKINIDDSSDSILKSFSRGDNDNDDADDGTESKLGVWTKVKPRKKDNNGRRSSDRALKIIQENSAILHKILACQAKKRLPDLEEISKEITISPINEEISKIFSPILEKMGLNEHEINEELARINFKDFDNMTATSVSEFDEKINNELSKLSLIDDMEQKDNIDLDDNISHDCLDMREALIDRKINEELSKLLANYEEESLHSNLEKGSSSQNVSDIDLTSISTNVFSYKSSNDSIDARSDLATLQEPTVQTERFSHYTDSTLQSYTSSKYVHDLSPKSDIDIYRELEKLDKISSGQLIPDKSLELSPKVYSPVSYASSVSPYADAQRATEAISPPVSPLKNTYDSYDATCFKSSLSPRRVPNNPYITRPYDISTTNDTKFDFMDHTFGLSMNRYDVYSNNPLLTKDSLEFRPRYYEETSTEDKEFLSSSKESRPIGLDRSVPYYGTESGKSPVTPTKYVPKEERCLDSPTTSFLNYSMENSDHLRRKYDLLSPREYSHEKGLDYEKRALTLPPVEPELDLGLYLPTRHRDFPLGSPNNQFITQQYPSPINHFAPKLSADTVDETKQPASHPELPDKSKLSNYMDTTTPARGSSCFKKSSLTLGNIGHTNDKSNEAIDSSVSPNNQFMPFPVRNASRKPKELGLKLGLYSPKGLDFGQLKKS